MVTVSYCLTDTAKLTQPAARRRARSAERQCFVCHTRDRERLLGRKPVGLRRICTVCQRASEAAS